MSVQQLGLIIVSSGVIFLVVGLVVSSDGFSWFGNLPGDIKIMRASARVYIPTTSMLLVSLSISAALRFCMYLWWRFF